MTLDSPAQFCSAHGKHLEDCKMLCSLLEISVWSLSPHPRHEELVHLQCHGTERAQGGCGPLAEDPKGRCETTQLGNQSEKTMPSSLQLPYVEEEGVEVVQREVCILCH